MDTEIQGKILKLKSEGLSERIISKQTGIPKTSVHRIIHESRAQVSEPAAVDAAPATGGAGEDKQGSPSPPVATKVPSESHPTQSGGEILTPSARFRQLLGLYSLKPEEIERVDRYTISFGDNVYEDMPLLKKALTDQGVKFDRANTIIRHWCNEEGLPPPPVSDTPAGGHGAGTRWVISNGRPVKATAEDEDEDCYTFHQAMDVVAQENRKAVELATALSKIPQGNQPNAEVEALRAELRTERDTRQRQQEAEAAALRSELKALRLNPSGKNEFDVMTQAMTALATELSQARSDFKASLPQLPAVLQGLRGALPPKPPADETASFAAGLKSLSPEGRLAIKAAVDRAVSETVVATKPTIVTLSCPDSRCSGKYSIDLTNPSADPEVHDGQVVCPECHIKAIRIPTLAEYSNDVRAGVQKAKEQSQTRGLLEYS